MPADSFQARAQLLGVGKVSEKVGVTSCDQNVDVSAGHAWVNDRQGKLNLLAVWTHGGG